MKPYTNTRLATYPERRVLELRPKKKQQQIALEAGFRNPNMITIIKSGASKLPLDRVPRCFLPFQRTDRTIKPWDQTPRLSIHI